ncbi:MAG: hypothetical protein ACK6B2_10740, partial [Planctomycetota bacterium]
MAFDSVAGVDYSRSLEVPSDSSSTDNAALRSEVTDAQNRAKLLADSLHSDHRNPNAPYSSQLMHYGEAAKASGTMDIGLANQAAWQDWSESLKNSGTDSKVESSLLALTDPIRQLSSSWSAQKGTDSVDLLRESPVSNRSQSIDDAGGFDPSKVWVGASLVSDRRTFALFQPISTGTHDSPVDVSGFVGKGSQGLSQTLGLPRTFSESEGSEEPSPLSLPTDGLPAMVLTGVGFRIDQYVPSFTTSDTTTEFVGGFSALTTPENADLTLPGLSWVHTVSRVWNSPTQWSITETIVLAFNASVASTLSQTMPSDDSGDPDDQGLVAPHLTSGGGTVSISAGRFAHLIVVIHADRGFTADSQAGVSWSVRSSSLDSRNMQVEASASTSTTPNPQYTDPTWLEDGGILGRTDDPDGPVPVPRNYTSGASLSFGANVQVSFGGSLTASGTPVLVPNSLTDGFGIETDLTYTNNRLANLGIGLHSSAGFHSGSGNIDSVVPITGEFENSSFAGLRRGPNPDNSDVPTDVPPIPAPTSGIGHSLGVSTTSASSSQSSIDHRIAMRAKLDRNGDLKTLEGQMRNKAQDQLSQQGSDNNALTLRHLEGDAIKGFSSVITTGRNAKGNVVLDAGNKFQAELGLGQDNQATFLPDEVKTELDVGAETSGVDFEFVVTSGWGRELSPNLYSAWNSTIQTKKLKRQAESIDADTGIEDHTQLSGEATREGAFKTFESESYKSNVTLTKYFPDSQSVSGEVAFDTVNMTNEDSWSFLTIGGGQIKTSGGQDDQVIATGGSSALAVETLTYQANATRNLESIHPAWDYLANESRNASYNKQIVSTMAFDPNDPDAVDPSPVITGDDRVIVTGNQWYLRVRKMPAGPGPQGVQGEYEESYFDLASGQRRTRTNNPTSGAGLDGMGLGGDPLSGDPWIITYEEDWDPRNVYESKLDGIRLPEGRIPSLDQHLYVLPEGYKAPTSNTNGRTWMEYAIGVIAGQKGDAFDQSINGISGLAAGIDFGLSTWIRRNNGLFEDRVDYESPVFVGGEIVGTVGSAFVNPTGIAAKGTAIYNLYN